jgi:GTP-binding protein HflX
VLAEKRLFATLDPSSRRLRFPKDIEVIITDTVGFIRDLPRDLMVAFRATLEELEGADLLLHVVDLSNPHFEDQIRAVEAILEDLGLGAKACLTVFNKRDRVTPDLAQNTAFRHGAVAVSARDPSTLPPLIARMRSMVASISKPESGASPSRCRNETAIEVTCPDADERADGPNRKPDRPQPIEVDTLASNDIT